MRSSLDTSHVSRSIALVLWTLLPTLIPPVYADTITAEILLNSKRSQVTTGLGALNDEWISDSAELIDSETRRSPLLHPDDTLVINVTLDDAVTIDDGFFNGDESIYLQITSEGGFGGGLDNNAIDFSYAFAGTPVGGTVPATTTGNADLNPSIGKLEMHLAQDLIKGGSATFSGLIITLHNVHSLNTWEPFAIKVGVDADSVSVPESHSVVLMLIGLSAALFRRHHQTSKRGIDSTTRGTTGPV